MSLEVFIGPGGLLAPIPLSGSSVAVRAVSSLLLIFQGTTA